MHSRTDRALIRLERFLCLITRTREEPPTTTWQLVWWLSQWGQSQAWSHFLQENCMCRDNPDLWQSIQGRGLWQQDFWELKGWQRRKGRLFSPSSTRQCWQWGCTHSQILSEAYSRPAHMEWECGHCFLRPGKLCIAKLLASAPKWERESSRERQTDRDRAVIVPPWEKHPQPLSSCRPALHPHAPVSLTVLLQPSSPPEQGPGTAQPLCFISMRIPKLCNCLKTN